MEEALPLTRTGIISELVNAMCRYRDLSYSIWGPFGFYATILFQQVGSNSNRTSCSKHPSALSSMTVELDASVALAFLTGCNLTRWLHQQYCRPDE